MDISQNTVSAASSQNKGPNKPLLEAGKTLRVLVVCHAYVTAINQGKLDAIAQMDNTEVALLSPAKWKAMGWDRVMTLEQAYPTVKLYPADIVFSGRVGAYFYWPWKIWQVIQDFKPDIIHVEQEVFSISALELAYFARLFKTPLSVFGWENMDRQLSSFRQWIRQFVFDRAQLIIPGNKDGESLIRQWGYTGQVEIMPQIGVDTILFPPKVRQRTSGDIFKIGFMGRLVPQKGVDLIFSAAQQLLACDRNIQLIICGSGSEQPRLEKMAQEKGISQNITWRTGISHDKVPEEMDKFDVLILPSRTIETWKEQFGHVLIEAMSMGIPTVGSDSGEIPNVIGNPDLVFPEEDSNKLFEILNRMIENPVWYQTLSQDCITRVDDLYSHERIAQRLTTLWRALEV